MSIRAWKLDINKDKPWFSKIQNSCYRFDNRMFEKGTFPIAVIPVYPDFAMIVLKRTTKKGFVLFLADASWNKKIEKWTSRWMLKLKGNKSQLEDLERSIDKDRINDDSCMGIRFFFSKIFFGGFTEIGQPYKKPKPWEGGGFGFKSVPYPD